MESDVILATRAWDLRCRARIVKQPEILENCREPP